MPEGDIAFEKFWTTANQAYGKHWEMKEKRNKALLDAQQQQAAATSTLPPCTADNSTQLNSQGAPQMQPGSAQIGTEEPIDTFRAPGQDTQRSVNSNPGSEGGNSYLETQRTAMGDDDLRAPPAEAERTVTPSRKPRQYTDAELLQEVDFVGRAAKMAKAGESATGFPAKQPAEEYMERVQTRFWNAMN